MNKKIFLGISILMIAIVGTVKVFNDEYLDFENLSIVNVDALTQSESHISVLIGGCN